MLFYILGFIGIAAFAASGALIGVKKRLDLFGVCFVGITTGIGGGIIRDVLLGIHPRTSLDRGPTSWSRWRPPWWFSLRIPC